MEPDREVIIVIDDEEQVRTMIVRLLRGQRYEVLEAENGERALEVMTAYDAPVHLVVSDIMMPEMDGLELVNFLRSAYPQLRALLVSGQSAEYMIENHDRIPSHTHFLPKPLSPAAFTRKVREILDGEAPPTE